MQQPEPMVPVAAPSVPAALAPALAPELDDASTGQQMCRAGDCAAGPEVSPFSPVCFHAGDEAGALDTCVHEPCDPHPRTHLSRAASSSSSLSAPKSAEAKLSPPSPGSPRSPGPHRESSANSLSTSGGFSLQERDQQAGPCMRRIRPRSVCGYFVWCSLATTSSAVIALALWSDMGIGNPLLLLLLAHYDDRVYFAVAFMAVFTLLYILDFFCPPHLPGKFCKLWAGDVVVGRLIFGFGLLLVLLSVMLYAKFEPSIPLIITICLGPVGSSAVWWLFPAVPADQEIERSTPGAMARKMRVLHSILDNEVDEAQFYKGATAAFMLNSAVVGAVWLYWALQGNTLQSYYDGADPGEAHDTVFIVWFAPIVLASSNLIFGLFVLLRVLLNRSYNHTNELKNSLLVDVLRGLEVDTRSGSRTLEEMEVSERKRMTSNKRRLAVIIKIVVCILCMVLTLIFIMGQLIYVDSKVVGMTMELAAVFLGGFVVFCYVSFPRIFLAIGASLMDLPAYKALHAALQKDWPRSLLLCFIAPVVPFLLLMSAVTQAIRRCRGIADLGPRGSGGTKRSAFSSCRRALLTARAADLCDIVEKWSWTSVLFWCYLFCGIYVVFTLTPLCLNIGLAWLHEQIAEWSFGVVILITFMVGIVTFLLPPVPGAIVYLFGGMVLSDTCPWGFWPGSIINIAISLIMKLCACAVQQKCIGELLGRSVWVRQAVGVHRMGIRCVESILRRPGWSVGKVAILCGGPDWPTSVLAGILKLSLVQCELGTLPIIGFITPCALTGSLYLKRGTSELWTRMANAMTVLSTLVSLGLVVTVAWALQCELDERCAELSQPLPENIHLHWLDFKAAEVKSRSAITWADLPGCIRLLYAFGAMLHIFVLHAFLWFRHLFGTFNVTDNIADVKLYGEGGILPLPGVVVMLLYALGWVCYAICSFWQSARTRGPRMQAMRELDAQEAAWKERWLYELKNRAQEEEVETPPPKKSSGWKRSLSADKPEEHSRPRLGLSKGEKAADGACDIQIAVEEVVEAVAPVVVIDVEEPAPAVDPPCAFVLQALSAPAEDHLCTLVLQPSSAPAEDPPCSLVLQPSPAPAADPLGTLVLQPLEAVAEDSPEATSPADPCGKNRVGKTGWVVQQSVAEPAGKVQDVLDVLPAPACPSAPPPPPMVPEATEKAPWEVSDEMSLEALAGLPQAYDFIVPVSDSLPLIVKIPPPPEAPSCESSPPDTSYCSLERR